MVIIRIYLVNFAYLLGSIFSRNLDKPNKQQLQLNMYKCN